MKKNVYLFSVVVSAVGLFMFVTCNECPPDKCAQKPPTVDNGIMVITVFYDYADPPQGYQWNSNMVGIVCDALDLFKEHLIADFKMGASTWRDYNTNELICKSDCQPDRYVACAAMHVPNFPQFACCYNRGKPMHKCAEEQGVDAWTLDDCVNNRLSDEVLLGNSNERINAELPVCYLPDVLYNGRNDRCKQFFSVQQLVDHLCTMYNEAGIQLEACET